MFRPLALSVFLALAPVAALAQTATTATTTAAAPADSLPLTVPSQIMGKTRELNVLLPSGYDASGETYPVIYLLDGGVQQDWPTYSARIRAAMDGGQLRPAILVGIATEDRQNELTERASDRRIIRQWPNHGQSERFRRFISDEVKPLIQERYRTNGDDAVLGESAAALFIVETFLKQPTLFDRYLAVSPSLWWDREALSKNASTLLAAHPEGERQLLLTIADEGGQMQSGMDRLVAALRNNPPKGLAWDYEPRHSETHSTVFAATALDFLGRAYSVQEPVSP
ncbi:alpha/beta hydrolase-fold protein [Brevundimonas sp.]|uniref:alpha/beta hydrolase n=1 Tax=Brevundimonas sp. TaxID=1871086 RepID=UPI002898438E|nr:alpha/beta hydrolase-fold protein [Brevundimonas sp.]